MDFIDTPLESRDKIILELREFSRRLVRELSFMRNTLADSRLAPSAVHAIIEIGATPGMQARDLATILWLNKSNASRQIARLEAAGYMLYVAEDIERRCALRRTDANGGETEAAQKDRQVRDQSGVGWVAAARAGRSAGAGVIARALCGRARA